MPRVIIGGRQVGKTRYLILESAKHQTYILVSNRQRALQIVSMAKDMGIDNLPFPVTAQEYFESHRFRGSSIQRDGIYIDDVDDVVQTVFGTIPIKAVSFTLDEDDVIRPVELWPKENPYLKGNLQCGK